MGIKCNNMSKLNDSFKPINTVHKKYDFDKPASYQNVKVSPASSNHLTPTSSGRRGCSASSADRSRTADSLADFEFHPSSLGHSYLFDPTCERPLTVQQRLQEPPSIWKFLQFLNYWFTEGVYCVSSYPSNFTKWTTTNASGQN